MNNYDKLHSEELYFPGDPEIMEEQNRCLELLYDYNATRPSEPDRRAALLKEMFAEIGEGCYIEPPFGPISEGITSTLASRYTRTLT